MDLVSQSVSQSVSISHDFRYFMTSPYSTYPCRLMAVDVWMCVCWYLPYVALSDIGNETALSHWFIFLNTCFNKNLTSDLVEH
jgi:hypothetical protein